MREERYEGGATANVPQEVERAIGALDFDRLRMEYWHQDECLFLETFLPPEVVEQCLVPDVEKLKPNVHRNRLPSHKKGGSISSYTLREKAPVFLELYRSPAFIDFVSRLVGARLVPCPESDPHAVALYYYTEPKDFMGFHYDTSYYRGAIHDPLGLGQPLVELPALSRATPTGKPRSSCWRQSRARWSSSMATGSGTPSLRSASRRSEWSSRWSTSRTPRWE